MFKNYGKFFVFFVFIIIFDNRKKKLNKSIGDIVTYIIFANTSKILKHSL